MFGKKEERAPRKRDLCACCRCSAPGAQDVLGEKERDSTNKTKKKDGKRIVQKTKEKGDGESISFAGARFAAWLLLRALLVHALFFCRWESDRRHAMASCLARSRRQRPRQQKVDHRQRASGLNDDPRGGSAKKNAGEKKSESWCGPGRREWRRGRRRSRPVVLFFFSSSLCRPAFCVVPLVSLSRPRHIDFFFFRGFFSGANPSSFLCCVLFFFFSLILLLWMWAAAQTDPATPTADVVVVQPTAETGSGPDADALFSRRARKRRTEGAPKEEEEARPRQRRRAHRAPADLISLPSELAVAVALWLDPVDLARTGATCRRLAEIAADQPLWRHVFGRLYEPALYAGSAAGVMGAYGSLRETQHADSASPPPPLPFAHMMAAGRDWRWLCLVHDAEARRRRDSPTSGSPLGPSASADGGCARYASPPGSRNADYAVEIRRNAAGHLVAWIEAVWTPSDGAPQPRAVLARADHRAHFAADAATASSALGGGVGVGVEGIARGRIVNHAGRMLYEGACRHGLAHGHGVVTDAGGRRWKAVSRNGTTLSTTLRPADGRVEEIVVRCVVPPQAGAGLQGQHQQQQQRPWFHDGRAGRRHTSAALTVRYANGDRLHMLHAAHARAALFWCSPDCPDRRFAARRIECRSWAQALDIDALALWPLDEPGDDPDDPVRLFVDYVRGGHCGWGPEAQRHAERMDALGARTLLDGRAGSDVPYAVVRSDDAQVAAARFFFEALQ